MENGVFVFFIILFVPGLWLVFSFRREIRQRLSYEEQRRIEHERATRISVLHRPSRPSPSGHARLPVEIAPPTLENRVAAHSEKVPATDWSSAQRDSRQDITASNIGAAFEIFLDATPPPSEEITTTQIDDAFEKFVG
jgi:hypothetical protein